MSGAGPSEAASASGFWGWEFHKARAGSARLSAITEWRGRSSRPSSRGARKCSSARTPWLTSASTPVPGSRQRVPRPRDSYLVAIAVVVGVAGAAQVGLRRRAELDAIDRFLGRARFLLRNPLILSLLRAVNRAHAGNRTDRHLSNA